MKSGQISENDIQRKVNRVRAVLGRWSPSSPSQALVSSAASFIRYNYISGVEKIILDNIDLAQVAHASSLADVNVSQGVISAKSVWELFIGVKKVCDKICQKLQYKVLFMTKIALNKLYGGNNG